MGFFDKAWNFLRGKGYRETSEIEQEQKARNEELLRQKIEEEERRKAAEDKQYEGKGHTGIDSTLSDEEKLEELARESGTVEELRKVESEEEERRKRREEVRKLEEKMARKPKKSDVETKLDDTTVNRVPMQTSLTNLNDLRPLYAEAFAGQGKLTDPDVLDALIAGRAHLKHRFTVEIEVYDDQGVAGRLNVTGILPENAGLVNSYLKLGHRYGVKEVEDMTIDHTSGLADALNTLKDKYIQTFGASGGSVEEFRDNQTLTIRDIKMTTTFA